MRAQCPVVADPRSKSAGQCWRECLANRGAVVAFPPSILPSSPEMLGKLHGDGHFIPSFALFGCSAVLAGEVDKLKGETLTVDLMKV